MARGGRIGTVVTLQKPDGPRNVRGDKTGSGFYDRAGSGNRKSLENEDFGLLGSTSFPSRASRRSASEKRTKNRFNVIGAIACEPSSSSRHEASTMSQANFGTVRGGTGLWFMGTNT